MARKLAFDRVLFVTCVGLAIAGLVMIFSASAPLALKNYGTPYFFLLRQSAACVIGLVGMAIAMHVDYRTLLTRPVVMTAVGASVLMLAGVLVTDRAHMVHRWFRVGPIQLQPSELAKLALVLYLAYQVSRREDAVNDTSKTILPIGAVVGTLAALVFLEPDLGTATLYVAITGVLLFLAGLQWRFIAFSAAAGAMVLTAVIIRSPYRLKRILAFLDPNGDPLGANFQVRQSILAVANGGIQGLSLGEGRQKLFYLPEPHTDFIFSVMSEELGLIGAVAIIGAFGVLLWRGLRAAQGAPDRGGFYLATAITVWLVLQAAINMGVVLGMLPTKGVPLPFLSYGGSSLVTSLVAAGVLLNVSQHSA